MKVLHLFSNFKWTGPAEPALNLCLALRKLGVEADFACAPGGMDTVNKIVTTARDRGLEPILRFRLPKHFNPLTSLLDRRALGRFLAERDYGLVHCHMDNDHRIAVGAATKLGIPIVRSSYAGLGLDGKAAYPALLARTACLIEPSSLALEHDMAAYSYPRERMRPIPGAVDVHRFDPAREVPDARRWLGVPSHAFVAGIVARMQTHRRYEDFFQAIRMLVAAGIDAHAIVVGRGTKQEKVGMRPVQEMGLEDRVHFPGFVDGENYVGMLKAFDAKVFLVPGSDGTCRALREAMAMAKPAVVADRGMLREIVDDGVDGMVTDGSARALFEALHRLAKDRQQARRMGNAARNRAVSAYSLEAQAAAVIEVYEWVKRESMEERRHAD